jgi:hypothetical protein
LVGKDRIDLGNIFPIRIETALLDEAALLLHGDQTSRILQIFLEYP